MNTECIDNIEFKTNNQEIITVSENSFTHLYISNIDENGEEINYSRKEHSSTLIANFFMVRLINERFYERLKDNKDIVSVGILFKNGYYQEFEIAKKRVCQDGKLENIYENIFTINDDLCILISDKNIKYKKGLFA